MEIAEADDVEAERPHRHQILERLIERSPSRCRPVKSQVEVIDERLVAGHRLERVAVRECHHLLAASRRRPSGLAQEIHAHPLHRAGRRIEQREILQVLRLLFAVGLTDAEREAVRRILAVVDVSEVRVLLAREEERVRRRERRERAALRSLGDEDAILRSHTRQRIWLIDAAELAGLRLAACVAPGEARGRSSVESPCSPASYL